jgi:hypothetical protein
MEYNKQSKLFIHITGFFMQKVIIYAIFMFVIKRKVVILRPIFINFRLLLIIKLDLWVKRFVFWGYWQSLC